MAQRRMKSLEAVEVTEDRIDNAKGHLIRHFLRDHQDHLDAERPDSEFLAVIGSSGNLRDREDSGV